MNILFLCNEFLPEQQGGLGRVVWNLAHQLQEMGHQIYIRGFNSIPKEDVIHGIQLKYIREEQSSLIKRQQNRENLLQEIIELHNKVNIDLIEVPDFQGLLPCRSLAVPTVVRLHGCIPDQPARVRAHELKTLSNHPYWIHPSDKILKETLIMSQVTPVKTEKIHNPISLVNPCEIPLPGSKNTRVLFVGKNKQQKGYEDFIARAKELKTKRPELEFITVGISDTNDEDDIHHLGKISQSALAYVMEQSTLLLQLSKQESFSMVTAEAMLHQLAIVCYPIEPYTEYLDEQSTFFIENKDARCITEILDAKKELTAKTKSAYKHALTTFNTQQCAERTLEFYKDVIACH